MEKKKVERETYVRHLLPLLFCPASCSAHTCSGSRSFWKAAQDEAQTARPDQRKMNTLTTRVLLYEVSVRDLHRTTWNSSRVAKPGHSSRSVIVSSCPQTPSNPYPLINFSMPPPHQNKKRKSSISSLNPAVDFERPPSPAPSEVSSSTKAGGGASSSSRSAAQGHSVIGGGVGELIGTGTGPGDVNEPGISV